jgi:superfamily II DNA or RNA helicase
MSDTYLDFLASKSPAAPSIGITGPLPPLNPRLFDFQLDLAVFALRRGRAAIFAGTGLGKTLMQLEWASTVAYRSGGYTLILTPLAVAQQTVEEAAKFGIDDVAYAKDAQSVPPGTAVVVTNYDRFDRFDIGNVSGIVLDESSILKHHDSKTRIALTEACRDIPFKLCCTATPAPNDWVELGNHAEFLGISTQKEMLAMYFVHDGSIRAGDAGGAEGWRLKRHAERAFWEWVASWAAFVRSPEDLGYDMPGYALPPLRKHQVTVPVEYRRAGGLLFPLEARTLGERIGARRDTIAERVAAAARIVNAQPDRPWLVWCNLNAEADALVAAIPGAEQVTGADPAELKAQRLLGFCRGEPRVLVSKPSIAGFGMNWQHCADMVFVGLNDSFEQLYQAIRRCWRFGQQRPVNVYMVASELEGAVVANLEAKERAYEEMGEAMALHMRDLTRRAVREARPLADLSYTPNLPMELPDWLVSGGMT